MSRTIARWMMMRSRAALLTTTCVWLAACGSGGGGSSSAPPPNNPPVNNPPAGIANLQPTFASIQDNVFTPICTACHTGAAAPMGLRLDAANSYGLLVGVATERFARRARQSGGELSDSEARRHRRGRCAHAAQRHAARAGRHQHHPPMDYRRRATNACAAAGGPDSSELAIAAARQLDDGVTCVRDRHVRPRAVCEHGELRHVLGRPQRR